MNPTLDEIIAKKKQKELEAAQIAEKLAKAKRYKELKKRKQNVTSSSANTLPSASCSTSSSAQRVHSSKENENPNSLSNTVATLEASPNSVKRSKDLHANSQLLRKAGALVRDSQDPHIPIWVPGFSYPAQYCIRQTRSLSQKLQVDNVDCIDLDDCMFGSQRVKVKVEDGKSDSASVKSEQSTKSVKRKGGRRGKRRRRSNKLTQTSDSSDCGMKLESVQAVDGDSIIMQSSVGNIDDVSVLLMDEVKDDVTAPVIQQAPPMGGDGDTAQLLTTDNDNVGEPLMPGCDVMPLARPMECDSDTVIQLTCQPTEGNDNTDIPVSQQHTGSNNITNFNNNPMPEESTGNNDSTMYGLTESMLLLIDASCDQQTEGTCDQASHGTTSACQFWCEQGSNLNSKVTLCKDGSSSHLHCNTVLKHSIGGAMVPLLRVSNIASSTMSDENRFYVAAQLNGYIVVWLHSLGWTAMSHWVVPDESNLTYFHTLSLTGGVAVCTMTTSGTCRVSFIKENTTSITPQPVVHCTSNSLCHSAITCCWASKNDVLIAIACKDKIVIQAIENYSEKVKKQVELPFSGEVCSLCGMENNSTTNDEGVWLLAATPTGIAIFDITDECLLQNFSLSCSNLADSLLPKCLRAIREDCYTFIVLGYEYQKKREHQVVGWLVAIDNSDDTRTPLATIQHQKVSYAKLLREYMLSESPSSSNSGCFDYLSAVHDNQLVVATPTPGQRLYSWDQFTGAVTAAWTISGTRGVLIQCNSTVLAVNGAEEDCGNLYIYKLDET